MLELEVPDPGEVEPAVLDPAVPAVEPVVLPEPVEPLADEPDPMVAFISMKPPARVELDELVDPAEVEPLVPVVPPLPSCRQPVTVIGVLLPVALELCVLPLCGAAPTIHPAPIASANAVNVCLFMRNSSPRPHCNHHTIFTSTPARNSLRHASRSRRARSNRPRYKSLRHATAPKT